MSTSVLVVLALVEDWNNFNISPWHWGWRLGPAHLSPTHPPPAKYLDFRFVAKIKSPSFSKDLDEKLASFVWIFYSKLCTDLWVLDTGSGSGINHALSFCFQVTAVTWFSNAVSCEQRIIALDAVCLCLCWLWWMLPQLISGACGCHMVILYPATWQCAIVETSQTSFGVTIGQHGHGVAGLKRPDWGIWKGMVAE